MPKTVINVYNTGEALLVLQKKKKIVVNNTAVNW